MLATFPQELCHCSNAAGAERPGDVNTVGKSAVETKKLGSLCGSAEIEAEVVQRLVLWASSALSGCPFWREMVFPVVSQRQRDDRV